MQAACFSDKFLAILIVELVFAWGVPSAFAENFIYNGKPYYYKKNSDSINAGFSHEGGNCEILNRAYQSKTDSPFVFVAERFQHTVSGSGCGHSVYGVIDVDGAGGVSGFLYLDSGMELSFQGEWVGDGIAQGVDPYGNIFTVKVD